MIRDWGYDELNSPEDVADYSKRDSRALSKVSDGDLVDELQVRLFEYTTLPAHELSERISGMMLHYEEVIERRNSDEG